MNLSRVTQRVIKICYQDTYVSYLYESNDASHRNGWPDNPSFDITVVEIV